MILKNKEEQKNKWFVVDADLDSATEQFFFVVVVFNSARYCLKQLVPFS